MPARNTRKTYVSDAYYHIYNRGVEKRQIFIDTQDYAVFLSYLKFYLLTKDKQTLHQTLSSPQSTSQEKDKARQLLKINNFADTIDLLAFCLMPNHFHFLIKQRVKEAIDQFMNSLGTRYTGFFNKKHNRVGTLYQDVYKAVQVKTDEQLLHLSRYIHRNPLPLLKQGQKLSDYAYSSYRQYLGLMRYQWVKPGEILNYFSSSNPKASYHYFVEGYNRNDKMIDYLKLD